MCQKNLTHEIFRERNMTNPSVNWDTFKKYSLKLIHFELFSPYVFILHISFLLHIQIKGWIKNACSWQPLVLWHKSAVQRAFHCMKDEEEWRLLFRVRSHLDKNVWRIVFQSPFYWCSVTNKASEHRNRRYTVVTQFALWKRHILHTMTCSADTFRLGKFNVRGKYISKKLN